MDDLLRTIFRVILEGVFGMTGHAVLWASTFGRWRPSDRLDHAGEAVAVLVGVLFWAAVGFGLWLAF